MSVWGPRIRRFRLLRGLSQRQFAEVLGVDSITISRWERGTQSPTDQIRLRLRELLGTEDSLQDRLLKNIVSRARDSRGLFDAMGRVLAISQAYAEALGGYPDQFVGRSFRPYMCPDVLRSVAARREAGWMDGEVASVVTLCQQRDMRTGAERFGRGFSYPVVMSEGEVATLVEVTWIDPKEYEVRRRAGPFRIFRFDEVSDT